MYTWNDVGEYLYEVFEGASFIVGKAIGLVVNAFWKGFQESMDSTDANVDG